MERGHKSYLYIMRKRFIYSYFIQKERAIENDNDIFIFPLDNATEIFILNDNISSYNVINSQNASSINRKDTVTIVDGSEMDTVFEINNDTSTIARTEEKSDYLFHEPNKEVVIINKTDIAIEEYNESIVTDHTTFIKDNETVG